MKYHQELLPFLILFLLIELAFLVHFFSLFAKGRGALNSLSNYTLFVMFTDMCLVLEPHYGNG